MSAHQDESALRAFETKDPPPAACKGCGGTHGSVGVSLRCLEDHLDAARAVLTRRVCARCWLNLTACRCENISEVKP